MQEIGRKIIHLNTVDSTNNYAANLLKSGNCPHGTVIMADEQTAGRGQRQAIWESEGGKNLLLTCVICPDNLAVGQQSCLTHFFSLAAVDFLRKFGILAEVKWPNDIFVHDKKIAGILIENSLSQNMIKNSILGIGINVNQTLLPENATSMSLETGTFWSLNELIFSFCQSCNRYLEILKSGNFQELRKEYEENLYLKDTKALYEDAKGEFIGVVRGVNDDGAVKIDSESGEQKVYQLKEIRLIKRNIS